MKLLKQFSILAFLVLTSYAHETARSDKELSERAGLIFDGIIKEKKVLAAEELSSPDGHYWMRVQKNEYKVEILNVLKGEIYLDKDELVMKQRYTESNSNNGSYDVEYEVGENIRVFENLGEYKGDEFIPDSPYFDKQMRESNFNFTLTQDSCRPHLYGKPLDWISGEKDQHKHDHGGETISHAKAVEVSNDTHSNPSGGNVSAEKALKENKSESPQWLYWILSLVVFGGLGLFATTARKGSSPR